MNRFSPIKNPDSFFRASHCAWRWQGNWFCFCSFQSLRRRRRGWALPAATEIRRVYLCRFPICPQRQGCRDYHSCRAAGHWPRGFFFVGSLGQRRRQHCRWSCGVSSGSGVHSNMRPSICMKWQWSRGPKRHRRLDQRL